MSTEPVGSLAEEAAKLISVMQSWAADHGVQSARPGGADAGPAQRQPGGNEPGHSVGATDPAAGDEGADEGADEAVGAMGHGDHTGTASECRWCPLCQAVRVARATTPEVREHLASAGMSLAMAFKGLMEGMEGDRPRSTPVEKIDLDPDPNSPED